MNHVIRAADVSGLPVVSIETGEDIAEIRDVVYDPEDHKLIGFTLNKRGFLSGRLKDVLGASAISALGVDAVTVANESALSESDEGSKTLETEKKGEPISVMGNRVLTAEGTCLGTVAGVVLTTGANPEAVGYEIGPEDKGPNVFAPISAQIALSNDNLLLPSEATAFVRSDLEAFAAVVDTRNQSR